MKNNYTYIIHHGRTVVVEGCVCAGAPPVLSKLVYFSRTAPLVL